MKPQSKVPAVERLCYGFGDLASCLFWQTVALYLLFFYTDVFGMSAIAAGIMIGVSRLLDAVFDVVIGMLADRTKTRWGKFRPYILWGAVPLAISATLAFTTPAWGGAAKIIYAYVTFVGFMFLYSTVNIPYTSLLGVMSDDPVERTRLSSFKFMGAYLGGIVVSATALPLSARLGRHDLARGWTSTLAVYGITAVLLLLLTFATTQERIQPIKEERTAIGQDLQDIARNAPWLVLFASTICFILFACVRLSVTAHYFKYFVGNQSVELPLIGKRALGFEALTSIFNTLGQVLSLMGVILVPWFARWCGRKRALIIMLLVAVACTASFYFLKPHNLLAMFLLQAVGSITGGPVSALLWVLYADTADYSEWKNGRRATGLIFSASIMSNKMGWTLGSIIAGGILSNTGFIPNAQQAPDVLDGLKSMMSWVPSLAGVAAIGLLGLFYRLDEPTMARLRLQLDDRRRNAPRTREPA